MANKHQLIQQRVIMDWTKNKRGRLYNCSQGLFIPWAERKYIDPVPRWIGPLSKKFKGFPDTFGYEIETFYDYPVDGAVRTVPIFCVVEVKTKNDDLSKDQIRVMNFLLSVGVRCYVAREAETGAPDYYIEEYVTR